MNGILTDNELSVVSEVISSRMGLFFPKERWNILGKNLASAARELGYRNINGFIKWLLSAPLEKQQTDILAAHLTVSETYFWREPQVFNALTEIILPELVAYKEKRGKRIRIWSAGCSTGEEPYSIAIALHKVIPGIKDWDISILATDINEKALTKARSGDYTSWSFRNSPSWLKSIYFHYNKNRKYEIIPEIKEMVTFSSCNLTEDNCLSGFKNVGELDIIFCRNVLMYFTTAWAMKISDKFFHYLSKKGWLVVSSCELSSQLFSKLTPVNFTDTTVYRKTLKESDTSSNKKYEDFSNNLSQSSALIFAPNLEMGNTQPLQSSQVLPSRAIARTGVNPPAVQTSQSVYRDSYRDKIAAIRLLAGQGHLEQALSECNQALVSYKLFPGLYLIRASILQEMDKGNEAIRSLKQAVYIDRDFIMGHFTLGNLYYHLGNMKNAERYFSNALELLNSKSDDNIPEESEGLSAKYIREIILTNLGKHKSK